jgi:hypothetical protein
MFLEERVYKKRTKNSRTRLGVCGCQIYLWICWGLIAPASDVLSGQKHDIYDAAAQLDEVGKKILSMWMGNRYAASPSVRPQGGHLPCQQAGCASLRLQKRVKQTLPPFSCPQAPFSPSTSTWQTALSARSCVARCGANPTHTLGNSISNTIFVNASSRIAPKNLFE